MVHKMKEFVTRSYWTFADWAALLAFLLVLLYYATWAHIDVRNYIDLQTVKMEPTEYGQPVFVAVARSLQRTFDGGYRVEIRDENGSMFCSTGNIDLTYEVDSDLPDTITLNYWAGGGACQGNIPQTMSPGLYSVRTCHFVTRPLGMLPSKERCVNSHVKILPKGSVQ